MPYVAKKENMEFYFTLIDKSENEIEIEMYNTIYKLIKVKEEKDEVAEESAQAEENENWINAPGNKMSMSAGLAKAIVEAVKNPVYVSK